MDDAGKLEFRKDIYGRDATMISMLKSERGKDLENVVAHSQPSYVGAQPATLPPGVSFASNSDPARPVVLRAAVRRRRRHPAGPVGRRGQRASQRRVFTR